MSDTQSRAGQPAAVATGTSSIPDSPTKRPLLLFVAITVPIGWVLLSIPVIAGWPAEFFALAVVLLGLLPTAVILTARESGRAGVRQLLRGSVRPPRPLGWALVAAFGVPLAVWGLGVMTGGSLPLASALITGFLVNLVVGVVVINTWEETAWTGFVQRRAMARWGFIRGSAWTGCFFALIHLPIAFIGAAGPRDVLFTVAALFITGPAFRLLMGAMDRWSGRSLLTVGLLHASGNASGTLVDHDHTWISNAIWLLAAAAVVAIGAIANRKGGGHRRGLR